MAIDGKETRLSPAAQRWLVIGCVLGFLAVAFGAFGAHGLASVLEKATAAGDVTAERAAKRLDVWRTGVLYHLIHAPMIVVASLVLSRVGRGEVAAAAFGFGILVFSGTLYAIGLGGPSWLGAVTPLGGLSLMVGWIALAVAGSKASKR